MKIAFLEDDKNFGETIVHALELLGHEVHLFLTGQSCLNALKAVRYDVCLLDWEVPDINGVEVLASLKLKGLLLPVIFLTGRDAEEDIVQVINAGADDFIIKPPNINVLNARINALYRRTNPSKAPIALAHYDRLTVDFIKRKFIKKGEPVKLTEKETELGLYFFRHLGELLSRSHLTKVVWGRAAEIDTRTLDVHVSHLRTKLDLLPPFGWRLISVYHQGYRLEQLQ